MNETSQAGPNHSSAVPKPKSHREPRWPSLIAALAVGGLYTALPPSVAVGPRWLPLSVIVPLLVPVIVTHRRGKHRANRMWGFATEVVLTLFLLWSLLLLVTALPGHKESSLGLLVSAMALWLTNVLIFALWYWRLDAGGPNGRDSREGHPRGAFLFAQMTTDGKAAALLPHGRPWSPRFVDYVFLAFNTSTAFSPTDAAVLSRWAKVLTMIQASISLVIIAILAGRAVNIL